MKKYKLLQCYPSLPCEWEIGDKVERLVDELIDNEVVFKLEVERSEK